MDSFKVKINFNNHYIIKPIVATDEVDACWNAKALAEKFKGMKSFDLMYAE